MTINHNLVEELKWRGMIHDMMPGTEEQLNKEVDLHQRFASADGYPPPVAPVGTVAFCLVKQLVGGVFIALFKVPGIGVVTVAAAHWAALQKNQIADSRTVNRAEAFE